MKNCITADLNSWLSRLFIPLGKLQMSPLINYNRLYYILIMAQFQVTKVNQP